MKTIGLIAVMALTTYLVRMIPFVSFRRKVQNPFLKSVLYYMPYAILAAMTFPGILYATGDIPSAAVGLIVGLILSLRGYSLIVIALATSISALAIWLIR